MSAWLRTGNGPEGTKMGRQGHSLRVGMRLDGQQAMLRVLRVMMLRSPRSRCRRLCIMSTTCQARRRRRKDKCHRLHPATQWRTCGLQTTCDFFSPSSPEACPAERSGVGGRGGLCGGEGLRRIASMAVVAARGTATTWSVLMMAVVVSLPL